MQRRSDTLVAVHEDHLEVAKRQRDDRESVVLGRLLVAVAVSIEDEDRAVAEQDPEVIDFRCRNVAELRVAAVVGQLDGLDLHVALVDDLRDIVEQGEIIGRGLPSVDPHSSDRLNDGDVLNLWGAEVPETDGQQFGAHLIPSQGVSVNLAGSMQTIIHLRAAHKIMLESVKVLNKHLCIIKC